MFITFATHAVAFIAGGILVAVISAAAATRPQQPITEEERAEALGKMRFGQHMSQKG